MAKKKRTADEDGSVAVDEPQAGATTEAQQSEADAADKPSALIVLSGGQDSTTCLYWAKKQFGKLYAVTFEYGQRHIRELQAAKRVANLAGIKEADHEIVGVGAILKGTSPLLQHNQKVGQYDGAEALPGGLEATFVPMRNGLFLTLAANRAAVLNVQHIVTGVCQEDFGGYPDCRQQFIDAMQNTINEALGTELGDESDGKDAFYQIHAPLMNMTKAESVQLAASLPGCMDALAFSHTCYEGKYPPGPHNHASVLRAKGFKEAGLDDPLIVRAITDNLLPEDYPRDGYVAGTKYALK